MDAVYEVAREEKQMYTYNSILVVVLNQPDKSQLVAAEKVT